MKSDNLATEILRAEKNRTAFWFAAFIVTLAALIVGRVRKGGAV